MKLVSSLALLLFFVSCGGGGSKKNSKPQIDPAFAVDAGHLTSNTKWCSTATISTDDGNSYQEEYSFTSDQVVTYSAFNKTTNSYDEESEDSGTWGIENGKLRLIGGGQDISISYRFTFKDDEIEYLYFIYDDEEFEYTDQFKPCGAKVIVDTDTEYAIEETVELPTPEIPSDVINDGESMGMWCEGKKNERESYRVWRFEKDSKGLAFVFNPRTMDKYDYIDLEWSFDSLKKRFKINNLEGTYSISETDNGKEIKLRDETGSLGSFTLKECF